MSGASFFPKIWDNRSSVSAFKIAWIESEGVGARSVRSQLRLCNARPAREKDGIRSQDHNYVRYWAYPLNHIRCWASHKRSRDRTDLGPTPSLSIPWVTKAKIRKIWTGSSVVLCTMHPFRLTIPQIRIIGFVRRNGCIAQNFAKSTTQWIYVISSCSQKWKHLLRHFITQPIITYWRKNRTRR